MQEGECIVLAGPQWSCAESRPGPEKKGQWDQGQQDCCLLLRGIAWVPCSPQTLALPPPESCLMGSHHGQAAATRYPVFSPHLGELNSGSVFVLGSHGQWVPELAFEFSSCQSLSPITTCHSCPVWIS